jgi:hypothetical protein
MLAMRHRTSFKPGIADTICVGNKKCCKKSDDESNIFNYSVPLRHHIANATERVPVCCGMLSTDGLLPLYRPSLIAATAASATNHHEYLSQESALGC